MDESLQSLCGYLEQVAAKPDAWKNRIFLEFCEVSAVTYKLKGCIIYKEGHVNKRSGGRFKEEKSWGYSCWGGCFRSWSKRWFVITDQYLAFLHDSTDDEPNEVMLIDSNFHIVYGEDKTGDELGINVINNRRKLELRANDAFEWTTWL
jgi:hypothetical protein